MRLCSVQVLLAVGLAWLLLPEPARAQPPGRETSYEATIRHAVEEYSLGHWAEARFFFARAHAQDPNARTLRGLGLACYESRSYVDAIEYFKQALANTEQPLTQVMRADLERLLQQAQQFVTRVSISLQPASAALEVDHVARALGADGALLLDPGEHELSVRAQGFVPERRVINVERGEQRLALRLRALSAPAAQAATRPVAPASVARSQRGDLAPYVVMGAGGAALIVGAVLGGIASADKSAVENAKQGTPWSELEPRYDRGRTFFPVGFTLMGVGLAAVAAGATWKLWPATQEREPHAQLRLTGAGLQLSGRY